MAVASKIAPCVLLAASLVGCAGNVIEGLPYDGGSVTPEDPAGQTGDGGSRDAGMVLQDATIADSGSTTRDSGTPPRQDASTTPQTDSGAPNNTNDAGANPGTALNGGPLARPMNGRQFTATLTDWMGSPRCMEGTGGGNQVLFCDDFESGAAGGPPGSAWTVQGSNVTVSDDQPFRGAMSMRYSPPSGTPGQMQETKAVPSKLFGRVFVYFFTSPPTAPNDAKFTLVQVGNSDTAAANKSEVRLSAQVDPTRGNKTYWGIGSNGGPTGDWHTKGLEPESEIKMGAWTCVEWMFDGDANETRVWINNVEQLSLHTVEGNYLAGDEAGMKFTHPDYNYLKLGYWVYQTSAAPNPAVVFLDELALDDDQIGCSL